MLHAVNVMFGVLPVFALESWLESLGTAQAVLAPLPSLSLSLSARAELMDRSWQQVGQLSTFTSSFARMARTARVVIKTFSV